MIAQTLSNHRTLAAAIFAGPVFWFCAWTIQPALPAVALPSLAIGFIIQFCLLYPVLEEIVFRGWLQGVIAKRHWGQLQRYGISSANLLTSIAFTALHLLSQPWQWALVVILPSLLFGHLKEHYRSLMQAILLHIFYNSGFLLFVMRG